MLPIKKSSGHAAPRSQDWLISNPFGLTALAYCNGRFILHAPNKQTTVAYRRRPRLTAAQLTQAAYGAWD